MGDSNYIPVPHPVVEPTRLITRPWMMFFQQIVDGIIAAGDVVGPSSSLNNQIVLFSGTTGKLIKGATGTGFVFATNGVYSVVSDISQVGYWSELTNGDPISPELIFTSFGDTIDLWVPTP